MLKPDRASPSAPSALQDAPDRLYCDARECSEQSRKNAGTCFPLGAHQGPVGAEFRRPHSGPPSECAGEHALLGVAREKGDVSRGPGEIRI